jgi:hypothetical protein
MSGPARLGVNFTSSYFCFAAHGGHCQLSEHAKLDDIFPVLNRPAEDN